MIGVVAHDAGGAEILASYIAKHRPECIYSLVGPAIRVFQRRLGQVPLTDLPRAVEQSDWLLCGTSWQSDLEWRALGLARASKKRAVTFLDHWVNYRERFTRNGSVRLPDEIWTGDSIARDMAERIFPDTKVSLVLNPYFEDLRQELRELRLRKVAPATDGMHLLFVCENISEHALLEHGDERFWGYTEHDALRYIFRNISAISPNEACRVVVRPHPSDKEGKYSWLSTEFGQQVSISMSKGNPLMEEVAASDIVAGCESMAMVVGLLAGCRVISCIPPGGKECALPHPEIERLNRILS